MSSKKKDKHVPWEDGRVAFKECQMIATLSTHQQAHRHLAPPQCQVRLVMHPEGH